MFGQRHIPTITACIITILASTTPTTAQLVTVAITGEVWSASDPVGILPNPIQVGDLMSGTYTYDTSSPDLHSYDPSSGYFRFSQPPSGISLKIGNYTFETDPDNMDFRVSLDYNVDAAGSSWNDFTLESDKTRPLPDGTELGPVFLYFGTTKGDDTDILSSYDLPLTAPDMDYWGGGSFRISPPPGPSIHGYITSVVLIPEPATITLLATAALALIRRRPNP